MPVVYRLDVRFARTSNSRTMTGKLVRECATRSVMDAKASNSDGRADLVCVRLDGSSWLTYNYPTSGTKSFNNINWTRFGWILIGQNAYGNQARFADLNGEYVPSFILGELMSN